MTTFRNYILSNFGLEMPSRNREIPASWFTENGLPLVVACTNCGMTMASPWCWVDHDGQCYCDVCAGAEED